MNKYIPILSTALLFASASVATAASATFTFLSDTGTAESPANFWDAVSAESEYGAFYGNDPYSIWCNQLSLNGNSKTVYLDITGNLSDNYPNPTGEVMAVNFFFNGVNMNLSGSSAQINANVGGSGRGTISLANGTVLTVSNGAKVGLGTVGTINDSTVEGIYMNNTSAASVIIQGASYFYNRNTKIGNSSSTEIQSVKIIGSDNDVFFRNLQFIGTAGTSAESPLGGVLEWVADANGITTINHSGGMIAFGGVLKFDFTNLVWDESWGDEKIFTLISCDTDTSLLDDWVAENVTGELAEFIGVDGGEFTSDSKHLYLTIARDSLQVPEPSTYAAIFGAIALAFAAYRRRK